MLYCIYDHTLKPHTRIITNPFMNPDELMSALPPLEKTLIALRSVMAKKKRCSTPDMRPGPSFHCLHPLSTAQRHRSVVRGSTCASPSGAPAVSHTRAPRGSISSALCFTHHPKLWFLLKHTHIRSHRHRQRQTHTHTAKWKLFPSFFFYEGNMCIPSW